MTRTSITFDQIELERFKSFISLTTIQLNKPGVTYLCGDNRVNKRLASNGAGKSTIFDAVTWVLTGKTLSGLKNPDIRARNVKGVTSCKLNVTVNKQKHEIERSTSGTSNKLTLDGKAASQDEIENLVPLPINVLGHTVIFGQGRKLFFDLQPRDKMELLSDVINLDRWDERASRAKAEAADIKSEVESLKYAIRAKEGNLSQISVWIEHARHEFDRWAEKHTAELSEALAKIEVLNQELAKNTKEYEALDLQYESAATEYKALENEVNKLRKDLIVEQKKGEPCPTCGQPVINQDCIAQITTQYEKAADNLTPFRRKADALKDKLMSISPQIARVEGQLKIMQEAVRSYETNPHRKRLNELKKQREDASKELSDIKISLSTAEQHYTIINYWGSEGFRLIKLYLIDDLLHELRMTTLYLLEELGLSGWKLEYVVERETKAGTISQGLAVLISQAGEEPVKWESFSGGEYQRLKLAGSLALANVLLNHAGVDVNLLVLDEPTQHLSEAGVSDLCATLSDYAHRTGTSIFFVDHHSIESPHFASIVTVVKDNDGSHIKD